MREAPPDPEYLLRGVAGAVFGRSYSLLAPTTVGRSPERDICLDDPGISRLHARLRPMEYGLEVEDAGSTNGTFLNGQRIKAGIARAGDEIAFDRLRFRIAEARRASPPTESRTTDPVGPPRTRSGAWGVAALVTGAAAAAILAGRWLATGGS